MRTTILAALLLLSALPAAAETVEMRGDARVIDGDTLVVDGERLRLRGIDAPETRQTCRDEARRVYRCGARATAELAGLAGAEGLRCAAASRDRYRRLLAVCFAGAVEINREMVRRGWALAYLDRMYRRDQDAAQAARAGLWAGDFEPPAAYRRAQRRNG